jgi:uncharacterized membrane protein
MDDDYSGDDLGAPERSGYMAYLKGPNKCKTFTDGTVQKGSWICWAYVVILALGMLTNLYFCANVVRKSSDDKRVRNILATLLSVFVSFVTLYVMYQHCASCNGWVGFFIVIVVNVIMSLITAAISSDMVQKYGPN